MKNTFFFNTSINWKLVGLFLCKLFIYLLLIPIAAAFVQEFTMRVALPLLFHVNRISGPNSISMQMWAVMAFFIYTGLFYIYVFCIRYVKSKFNRRLMLILFILIPGIFGGIQITMYIHLTIIGNLLYNGSYYLFYHIIDHFLPSFRLKLNRKKIESKIAH